MKITKTRRKRKKDGKEEEANKWEEQYVLFADLRS